MNIIRSCHARPLVHCLALLALAATLVGGSQPAFRADAASGPNPVTTATSVVSLVAKGDFAAAERYFSPALQAAAPAAQLRQIWQQLTAQLGAFERQTVAKEQTAGGVPSVFVHCVFARATADLVLSFDSAGKVDGLHVVNVRPRGAQPARITPAAALTRLLTIRPLQAAWFAPSLLAVVSVQQLTQALDDLTTGLGPYRSLQAVLDGSYRVRFRDGTARLFIHLDTTGRIDGFGYSPASVQLTLTALHLPRARAGDVAGRAAAIDALLTKRLQRHQFSGSVLVAVKGTAVLAKGYGYADLALQRPNTINTEFRIGSITKQFTAMAILELQAAGKLSITDKLCRYVQPCPKAWAPITLRELLTHTSGLPTEGPLPGVTVDRSKPISVAQGIALIKRVPLDRAPGTSFEYSNYNYHLLGAIVEQLTQQPYATYLQQQILDPLQLQHTGYDTNHPDLRTHALGYASWKTLAPYLEMSWPYAAGALYSNVGDLWHWDEALLSDTLIPEAVTADMFTSHVATCATSDATCTWNRIEAQYGYGWFSGRLGGHLVIDHGGDIEGFTAINEFMPNDGIIIVLLSNQANSGASSFLGLALAQIMLGQF